MLMFFLATKIVWLQLEKAPRDKQFKSNEFSGMRGTVWWCSGQHRFSSFHQLAQIIHTSLIGERGAHILSLRTTSHPGFLSYQAEKSFSKESGILSESIALSIGQKSWQGCGPRGLGSGTAAKLSSSVSVLWWTGVLVATTFHCPLLMGGNRTDTVDCIGETLGMQWNTEYVDLTYLTYFTWCFDRNEDRDERSQKAAFDVKEGTADCEDW